MDWLLVTIVLDIFALFIIPYGLYTFILEYWFQHIPGMDTLYHLVISFHILILVFYLQWIPRESKWFRSFWGWNWFRKEYFQLEYVDPHNVMKSVNTHQYMFAIHTHGVYPVTMIMLFSVGGEEMLHVKSVATNLLFKVPLLKEFAGLAGAIPANRKDMLAALQCGDSLAMCPGGIREVFQDPIIVKRKGFLQIAMAANVDVVPIWSPKENDTYSVWLPWPRVQKWILSAFYYPLFIFAWGNPWLPFFPKRSTSPMKVHVGEPLRPGNYKSVDEFHEAFYGALEKMKLY